MVKNVLKKKCCLCSPAGMVIELVSVFVNLEVTLLIFHCALQQFFFSPNCVLFNSKFFIFFPKHLNLFVRCWVFTKFTFQFVIVRVRKLASTNCQLAPTGHKTLTQFPPITRKIYLCIVRKNASSVLSPSFDSVVALDKLLLGNTRRIRNFQ